MPRALFLIVVGCVLTSPAALAQAPEVGSDDSRYSFNRIDDGYLRLDGRTGQVSLCSRGNSGWACQMVPD